MIKIKKMKKKKRENEKKRGVTDGVVRPPQTGQTGQGGGWATSLAKMGVADSFFFSVFFF